jgi:hypothetical protein
MPRAVILLGAGASADFGIPTLAYMFNDSRAQTYLKNTPKLLSMLRDMFWLPRGHDLESSAQSLNIEQMLTILKDLEREPAIPESSRPQDAAFFRRGLLVLIERAVFEGKSTKGMHLNPLLAVSREKFEHTTWASFNWDCVFEASFWYSQSRLWSGNRVNPSLAIQMDDWHPGSPRHTFLKLHGGINWWLVDDRVTYVRWTGEGALQEKWARFDQDPTFTERPVILEPRFYKYDDSAYKQLSPQWQKFRNELIIADCVIVIEYSLPEMDVNARSVILTGFQVNPSAPWLVVDPSEEVLGRYRRLLGHQRVTTLPVSLAGLNNDLHNHLTDAFPDIDFS